MAKTKRVNARITSEAERKLGEIVRLTGSSMSEVIMAAIESYWAVSVPNADVNAYSVLKKNKFIGCVAGDPSLSLNVKGIFHSELTKKYGHS